MSERPPAIFVGEHLALDFLNSIASPKDVPVEWLRDGRDLIDWLEQAKVIETVVAARFRASKNRRQLEDVAAKTRAFRDWLRGFVTRHMGKTITPAAAKALAPLNDLLAGDTSYPVVEAGDGDHALRLRRLRRWESPDELLHPVAEAAADLICNEDFRLIRACEGSPCTLLFLDRTKAHGRRWCSMAVCGNRAKVAAHRARKGGDGS
ncbi:CGNR zinc finger domain-containing protein [Zavarzinella formosa]|uniref:CGNR zinc finger domain-containing protein n=1 Tax=Zavarzinella formosa TaxID=360055 RepID=UPI0002F13D3E|nr:ABATE domain-containing protein [Zavarzinella formosa]